MRKQRFRFSLKAMLIVVALFALLLAVIAKPYRDHLRESPVVARFQELGGNINFYRRSGLGNTILSRFGADWMCRGAQDVVLTGTAITDADLELLSRLHDIKIISLFQTEITGAGLTGMANSPNLRFLDARFTKFNDEGLRRISEAAGLRQLYLANTDVTDAGLIHLARLTELEDLDLSNTAISDQGLQHLRGLTNLKKLELAGLQFTYEGVQSLEDALPNELHLTYKLAVANLRRAGMDVTRSSHVGGIWPSEEVVAHLGYFRSTSGLSLSNGAGRHWRQAASAGKIKKLPLENRAALVVQPRVSLINDVFPVDG